jgi:hypothetical protein
MGGGVAVMDGSSGSPIIRAGQAGARLHPEEQTITGLSVSHWSKRLWFAGRELEGLRFANRPYDY